MRIPFPIGRSIGLKETSLITDTRYALSPEHMMVNAVDRIVDWTGIVVFMTSSCDLNVSVLRSEVDQTDISSGRTLDRSLMNLIMAMSKYKDAMMKTKASKSGTIPAAFIVVIFRH